MAAKSGTVAALMEESTPRDLASRFRLALTKAKKTQGDLGLASRVIRLLLR